MVLETKCFFSLLIYDEFLFLNEKWNGEGKRGVSIFFYEYFAWMSVLRWSRAILAEKFSGIDMDITFWYGNVAKLKKWKIKDFGTLAWKFPREKKKILDDLRKLILCKIVLPDWKFEMFKWDYLYV